MDLLRARPGAKDFSSSFTTDAAPGAGATRVPPCDGRMPGTAGGGAKAATGGGAGPVAVAVGRPRVPTGRISSFSRPLPRVIHTLSRSTEESIAPGSISSFSRNAFGSFIPFAQRIARRAEGVEDAIVPTRTKFALGAPDAVLTSVAGSLDASFIPSPGAKRLFQSEGGVEGTPVPAGVAAALASPIGEYASRPRYRVRVAPSETAATTMETPITARQTGFRIHSPSE